MQPCKPKYKKLLTVLMWLAIGVAIFALGWHSADIYEERIAYDALLESIRTLPEPEQCALCSEEIPYHAPCLLNLSTGQLGELTVYTNDPTRPGELAPPEMQQTGTFNFQPCAGLMGIRDTCAHICRVTLPAKRQRMDPALFCMGCRLLLAGSGSEGYAILDLYDLPFLQVYPICKGKRTKIRDYRVTVTDGEEGSLDVCVTGRLDF